MSENNTFKYSDSNEFLFKHAIFTNRISTDFTDKDTKDVFDITNGLGKISINTNNQDLSYASTPHRLEARLSDTHLKGCISNDLLLRLEENSPLKTQLGEPKVRMSDFNLLNCEFSRPDRTASFNTKLREDIKAEKTKEIFDFNNFYKAGVNYNQIFSQENTNPTLTKEESTIPHDLLGDDCTSSDLDFSENEGNDAHDRMDVLANNETMIGHNKSFKMTQKTYNFFEEGQFFKPEQINQIVKPVPVSSLDGEGNVSMNGKQTPPLLNNLQKKFQTKQQNNKPNAKNVNVSGTNSNYGGTGVSAGASSNNSNNANNANSANNAKHPKVPKGDKNKQEPALEERFGKRGWVCQECHNFNFESRILCNRCGLDKDYKPSPSDKKSKKSDKKKKGFVERAGDWICNKCKNLNFSFRSVCNRCELTKAESDKIYNQYMNNLMNYIRFNEMLQTSLLSNQGAGVVPNIPQGGNFSNVPNRNVININNNFYNGNGLANGSQFVNLGNKQVNNNENGRC